MLKCQFQFCYHQYTISGMGHFYARSTEAGCNAPHNFECQHLGQCSFKGAVQGQKVWGQDFEITSEPKRPQRGPTFWSGLGPQTLRRGSGCHTHFPAKKGPKNRNRKLSDITLISYQQSIDNNFLSSHKKVRLSYGQKTYAHIWNIWYMYRLFGL